MCLAPGRFVALFLLLLFPLVANGQQPVDPAPGGDGVTSPSLLKIGEGDSVADRIAQSLDSGAGATAGRVLNFHLISVDGQPITPLKLTVAIIVFFVGLMLVRRIAVLAGTYVIRRFGVERDAGYLIQQILHYSLVIFVALFSMDVAGIPLKVLAFLGGAVAIAIGFGGQEILGNFMSGLLLMMERPIKIGDLIEYDGEMGKVESVGARSTKLLMPGNVHLIVPNKDLLENKIVNWNYNDQTVLSQVVVGVAYGSETRTVREVLVQAAVENPEINPDPKPMALFEDFGDNSLNFTLFFWTRVTNFFDKRRIESDVRFRIDDLCREHEITIAFPQRDVHLDTLSPIEVRLERGGRHPPLPPVS